MKPFALAILVAAAVPARAVKAAPLPAVDDAFAAPSAWTLPAQSLSVTSVDVFGGSVRFALSDWLQTGLAFQVANGVMLERFRAQPAVGGTQYRGTARAGSKLRLTARDLPAQLAITLDGTAGSWEYGGWGLRVLFGVVGTACIPPGCGVVVSLYGRAGRHHFSGGFDYGPEENGAAFEFGAAFAAMLPAGFQLLLEVDNWTRTGCDLVDAVWCHWAGPMLVAGGARWARGALVVATGVGRTLWSEDQWNHFEDRWYPFFVAGYTWDTASP
jgi:hypothetical protein